MSGLALGWAKEQQAPGSGSKALLVMLADYADDGLFAWPKIRTLAVETQKSPRQVQRLLRKLENDGLLIGCDVACRRTGVSRARAYWFPVKTDKPSPAQLKSFEEKVGAVVTVTPVCGAGEGDTDVTGRVSPMSPSIYGYTLLLDPSVPSERGPGGPSEAVGKLEPLGDDAKAWGTARALLVGPGGMGKRAAGRFFGRLLARHGLKAAELADALEEARRLGTADPQGWLVKAASAEATKRAEGGGVDPSQGPSSWSLDRWAIALDVAAERGSWPATFGPKPGDAGCLLPADLFTRAQDLGLARQPTLFDEERS